jgi:hypothetical protein
MSWKRCGNEKIELGVADVPTSSAIEEILCERSISMVINSTGGLNRPVAERDSYGSQMGMAFSVRVRQYKLA